jgi:Uncharacterized protein conserved in bacteria, COG3809
MKLCPICGVELRPRVVYEVEVDTCPKCGGVWLDGGELQKLIAKIRGTGRSTTAINAIESGRRIGVRKRRRKVFSIFLTRYLTEAPCGSTAEDAVDAASSPARRGR